MYVNASGQISNAFTFSYASPTITGSNPTASGIIAGGLFTIFGTSFGTYGGSMTISGNNCPLVSQTHTQVVCTVPLGCCSSQPVIYTVESRSSNTRYISYAPPAITSFSPTTAPTPGGTTVTITGTNFYTSGSVQWAGATVSTLTWSTTQITLTAPAGEGTSNNVNVFVGDLQTASPGIFAYSAPTITGISPTSAPTEGGTDITITGTSFGFTGTVRVNAITCSVKSRIAHTQIVCTVPASSGANVPVIVTTASQASPSFPWSYSAPSVTSVSPATGDTPGGYIVTVNGSSFGTSGTVAIGTNACDPQAWSHTQLTCRVSAGFGSNLRVAVTVTGQTSTQNVFFSYNGPAITGVSPTNGPTSGTTPITLTGSNFGAALGDSSFIGTFNCTETSHSHTQIVCTLPVGSGTNLDVKTTIGGQTATATPKFSYDAPSITSFQPLTGTTNGNPVITITGRSFDLSGTVTLGGQTCTVVAWSHTQITCTAPTFQGVNLALIVTTVANRAVTAASTFNYAAPTISSITPTNGVSAGGFPLTIAGTGFGVSPVASVTIDGSVCTVVPPHTHTQIICTVPAGQGINKAVVVTVATQTSNQVLFAYQDPVISSVTPQQQSTAGGVAITLAGTSLGTSGGTVRVGTADCPVTSQSNTQVICTLPPGMGSTNVQLTLSGSQLSNQVGYTYGAVTVTAISPTTPYLTKGGEIITITGTNFGATAPVVSIGGVACTSIQTPYSHTEIKCTTPAVEGTALTVLVTQGGTSASVSTYNTGAPTVTAINPTSLNTAGGALTITGTNFGLTSTVRVGTQACAVTSRTHEQLICTVAPGAGAGLTVTVTCVAQSNSAGPTFSYNSPTLTSITPSNGPTAGATTVTLAGTNFGPNTVSGSVSIGGASCFLTGAGWSHTSIECTLLLLLLFLVHSDDRVFVRCFSLAVVGRHFV